MTVPWFIGGVAEHSPEVARLLAFVATQGGAEGVGSATHWKVSPLDVPGTSVQIAAGSGAIRSRYPSAFSQSYIDRTEAVETVPITATGSGGGRRDMVIRLIEDPQYPGVTPPGDLVNGPYAKFEVLSNVPASAIANANAALKYLRDNNITGIPLAGVDLPVSTGTVQASHIVELRKLANPRKERVMVTGRVGSTQQLTSTSFVNWPTSTQIPAVDVPDWAGIHRIRADIGGVINQSAAVDGWLEVIISSTSQGDRRWDFPWQGSTGRHDLWVAGETPVGPEHRGLTLPVRTRARKAGGTGTIAVDASSDWIIDIEFEETPI